MIHRYLAYLDGVGDRHSTAHLKACAACRARARRLQRLEQSLAARLYRITCPTPMELGEYHLGALKRRQAGAIKSHIDGCPQCGREIARLEGFLGDLAPAPKPNLLEEAAEQIRVQIRAVGERRDQPVDAAACARAGACGGARRRP